MEGCINRIDCSDSDNKERCSKDDFFADCDKNDSNESSTVGTGEKSEVTLTLRKKVKETTSTSTHFDLFEVEDTPTRDDQTRKHGTHGISYRL